MDTLFIGEWELCSYSDKDVSIQIANIKLNMTDNQA